MPLFGSQLSRDTNFLLILLENTALRWILLNFLSVPTANKEFETGKLRAIYYSNGIWYYHDLITDLNLNHARYYSSFRRDVIHWKYESSTDSVFTIWFYGKKGSKTFTGIKSKVSLIYTNKTDSIHYVI